MWKSHTYWLVKEWNVLSIRFTKTFIFLWPLIKLEERYDMDCDRNGIIDPEEMYTFSHDVYVHPYE